MNDFLYGTLCTLSAVCTLQFFKSWRKTRDRLFIAFALAFFLLGLNWLLLAVMSIPDEARHLLYLLRLVAFLVLLVAIIDKNRAS